MSYLGFYILMPGLIGALMLFSGRYLKSKGQKMAERQKSQVQLLLDMWHIVVAEENEAQVIKVVRNCLTITQTSILTAVGIGMILVAVVVACLTLSAFGTVLINLSPHFQPFFALLYIVVVLGGTIGLQFALRKIRREAEQGVRYGDLRRRLVSDYRSVFMQVVPLPCLLLSGIGTVMLAPSVGASIHVEFINDLLSLPGWTIWLLPVLMVLFIVLVEVFIAQVVKFPRFLIALAPEIARQLDDMLRAIFVGWLLCSEFQAVSSLTLAQFGLLNTNITMLHTGAPVALNVILAFMELSGFLMLFAGPVVNALRGRLGGNILRQSKLAKVERV